MATFTRINNVWHIQGTNAEIITGRPVMVTRANGQQIRKICGAIVRDFGNNWRVCQIVEPGAPVHGNDNGNNGHHHNGNGHHQPQTAPVQQEVIPQPVPAPTPVAQPTQNVPAPSMSQTVNGQIDSAIAKTAKAASEAVNVLAGRQITGIDGEERRVRQSEKKLEILSGKVFQVNYYIPDCIEIENPSRIFRRHGFRLDGSNWVFDEKGLNHPCVQEVFAAWDATMPMCEESGIEGITVTKRIRWWVIPYTAEQLAAMKEAAQNQLAEELVKVHCSLIERIEAASVRLQEANATLDADEDATQKDRERGRDRADDSYNGSMRAAVKEASERFEMCLKGAELFDDTGSLDALFGAVRDVIRTQAQATNAMLLAKGRKGVEVPNTVGI